MPGTTPVYGFPYPEPTDLVADYPALGQQLAEDIEDVLPTLAGLTLIQPTSIANTGGSASSTNGNTTFSGVSTISLNGVFTSTYSHYRVLAYYDLSTSAQTSYRMRVAGADSTAASYTLRGYYAGAGTGNLSSTGQTSWSLSSASGGPWADERDFFSPQATLKTIMSGILTSGGTEYINLISGLFNATTAFDGLSLITSAGNMTGNIRVYGYKGA